MDWSLDTTTSGGTVRVAPIGELDLVTAPLLARALHEAEAGSEAALLLDLGSVSFMDSSGLATILEAVQRCADRGPALSIRPGSGAVMRVLALADLLDDLPLLEPGP